MFYLIPFNKVYYTIPFIVIMVHLVKYNIFILAY